MTKIIFLKESVVIRILSEFLIVYNPAFMTTA